VAVFISSTPSIYKLLALLAFYLHLIIYLIQNISSSMQNYKSYFNIFNEKINYNKIYDNFIFFE
jgi:hypothetical protein